MNELRKEGRASTRAVSENREHVSDSASTFRAIKEIVELGEAVLAKTGTSTDGSIDEYTLSIEDENSRIKLALSDVICRLTNLCEVDNTLTELTDSSKPIFLDELIEIANLKLLIIRAQEDASIKELRMIDARNKLEKIDKVIDWLESLSGALPFPTRIEQALIFVEHEKSQRHYSNWVEVCERRSIS